METAKEIMSKNVRTSDEGESIYNVAGVMKKYNISTVIITRAGAPAGIITERDMAQKVAANALDVKLVSARSVMSSPLKAIKPDTNIYYAHSLMQKEGFKKLPVLDEKGRLVGIVTQTDINNYFTKKRKEFVMKSLSKNVREMYPT
ncbi:MAG TPA: CBS domain-containing protein [Candidatus Nanoarchaeia archaeon]|nr:CBS domain-containing protein [Candidatus Nanoarchaeia archaeon]